MALRDELGLKEGDAAFFVAGHPAKMAKFAGNARAKIGHDLDLCEKNAYRFCWIVDFPMFEYDEDLQQVTFSHNPFSMPQGGLEALNGEDPLAILAYQYDIVCNGVELSSGAIRNHRPDIMERAFAIAGYGPDELEARFGGMLRALSFGAPPHGGIAPGIDRIVMAPRRHAQFARGHRLPPEPKGGRAAFECPRHGERAAIARAQHPAFAGGAGAPT